MFNAEHLGNKQWKEKLPIIAQRGDKHRSLRRRRLLSFCRLPRSPSSHTQTHTHTHTYTRLLHPPCSPPPRGSCAAVLSIRPLRLRLLMAQAVLPSRPSAWSLQTAPASSGPSAARPPPGGSDMASVLQQFLLLPPRSTDLPSRPPATPAAPTRPLHSQLCFLVGLLPAPSLHCLHSAPGPHCSIPPTLPQGSSEVSWRRQGLHVHWP